VHGAASSKNFLARVPGMGEMDKLYLFCYNGSGLWLSLLSLTFELLLMLFQNKS